ncbi:hypothetical protein AMTR_s00062p00086410 [Amborella trichopoda]|uniref:Fe2OG dioxygenase domain-containing protein n=1 Tax=Amborella trichopoda TaxID=13333 RepID=U5DDR7_AMBTC|nr:hypothetical protein AMTR_s00062p00086410 [Amborella trichopoda]
MQKPQKLGFKILELIALSLGLPAKKFHPFFENHGSYMHMNHYPPCSNPELALGKGLHTDLSAVSVHIEDNAGGFKIKQNNGNWATVKPLSGAYVVNTGDAMRVFTNDRIESVVHKVMVGGEERYSVVLAIEPTRNAIIEPLEEFVNEENPPKYKAFMWEKLSTSRKLSEFVKSDVKTLGA